VGELLPKGSRALPIKTAHVALRDADNDGQPDLFLSMIFRDARGQVQPVVLRNLSSRGGTPRFAPPPRDDLLGYHPAGPVADYDGDGRVDIFLASWFENLPNYLFRNTTAGGNWITVRVAGRGQGLNSQGIGAVVRVYQAGHAGDSGRLLGRHDIAVGNGYASCEEPVAHLGLGPISSCDVEAAWGPRRLVRRDVAANQAITFSFD
jgi:hypothetical protein